MLEYDTIAMSKENNANKTKESSRCSICYYYYYILEVNFRFQLKCVLVVIIMQKAVNFNDFIIAPVKENDYKIDFWLMRKEAKYLSKNSDLTEKRGNYNI